MACVQKCDVPQSLSQEDGLVWVEARKNVEATSEPRYLHRFRFEVAPAVPMSIFARHCCRPGASAGPPATSPQVQLPQSEAVPSTAISKGGGAGGAATHVSQMTAGGSQRAAAMQHCVVFQTQLSPSVDTM